MLEFVSTRTKVLAGVAVIAAAGAVASGIVDHKKLNSGDGSCGAAGAAAEAALNAAETVIDGAETTTQEIVGE